MTHHSILDLRLHLHHCQLIVEGDEESISSLVKKQTGANWKQAQEWMVITVFFLYIALRSFLRSTLSILRSYLYTSLCGILMQWTHCFSPSGPLGNIPASLCIQTCSCTSQIRNTLSLEKEMSWPRGLLNWHCMTLAIWPRSTPLGLDTT